VDPITAAVLLPLVGGVAGAAGQQVWSSLRTLVRRPAANGTPAPGTSELSQLEAAPDSQEAAQRLLTVLQTRAEADPVFGVAWQQWQQQATAIHVEQRTQHNEVSGGDFRGPTFVGGEFNGPMTFGPTTPNNNPPA
jgi:hypothetical protein